MSSVLSETVLADPRALERAMQRAGVSSTALEERLGPGAGKVLWKAQRGLRMRFLTLDKVACLLGAHIVELLDDPDALTPERWIT
jgi:hypothetical protein